MGKKGKKTRWRRLPIGGTDEEGGLSLEATPPTTDHRRITFNEDEYTKITTPRQDVLFKKGYLGRKRATITNPSETQEVHSGDSVESESYVGEEVQYGYPAGFMDANGVYYVNGSTYEAYDPYTGAVAVLVGPPPQYPGAPPVLAALPCQPVPLQPVEWFNPPSPWCYSYNKRKSHSPDSQNCSAQSSESTGPPGSPQEPVEEGACAMYPPQYMYPGYMFGPPIYNMNGVTVQGVVHQPIPLAPDPTAGKRRKKRRRKRRGGATDDGSESSCCEDPSTCDIPGCHSETSSDVVCQSGASSDAGAGYISSKANSDSGINTDPTPNSGSNSPPLHVAKVTETMSNIQFEQHIKAPLSVEEYQSHVVPLSVKNCGETNRSLAHSEDTNGTLSVNHSGKKDQLHEQLDALSVNHSNEEDQSQGLLVPLSVDVFTGESNLYEQVDTLSVDLYPGEDHSQLNQLSVNISAEENQSGGQLEVLGASLSVHEPVDGEKCDVHFVLAQNQLVCTNEGGISDEDRSPDETVTPDEISEALSVPEDDATLHLCAKVPECLSQESTARCTTPNSATKDLLPNENDIISPKELLPNENDIISLKDLLPNENGIISPGISQGEVSASCEVELVCETLHYDELSCETPLLFPLQEAESTSGSEITEVITKSNIQQVLNVMEMTSNKTYGKSSQRFENCNFQTRMKTSELLTILEDVTHKGDCEAETPICEAITPELFVELNQESRDDNKPNTNSSIGAGPSVEMNKSPMKGTCLNTLAPVPPPRRKRFMYRAAERIAIVIVEDAIREGIEEVACTRLKSPLTITEAVTQWLNSQGSSPLTCPVSDNECEEDEGIEVGEELTGQKNVRGNPFLVSSHSGTGKRVAKDCESLESSAGEWDYNHMCDPLRSVDTYYHLAAVEKMPDKVAPSVYKTAMHIRHTGPFPCGVCCIIQ